MTLTRLTSTPTLRASYAHCTHVTRTRARNFYYAFVTLPASGRRAICALYAYCRVLDDIADGPRPLREKSDALAAMRTELTKALKGKSTSPIFVALADTIERYDVPVEHLYDIADGVEQDLTVHRYQTFADLRRYCYLVASSVGLACLSIFGYRSEQARQAAVDLGIAMQLTNIIRDVGEDAERNRIYIPLEDLGNFSLNEKHILSRRSSTNMTRLLTFQSERAKRYYTRAKSIFQHLPRRSRPCPLVLFGVYYALLQQMERDGFNVLTQRTTLPKSDRIKIALRLWMRGLLWPPEKLS